MSKKSTKEGRHGEAAAFYDKFQEEYISEKSLSRAQQRFFGMVRAEQKGEMEDASPKVKEAAKSMKEKDVHDFASTKHKGLPEKKGDCKEEMSLVERILDEAIKGTIAGGTSRAKKYQAQAKDVRIKQIGSAVLSGDKKEVKRLKKANKNPTRKITAVGEVEDEPKTRESAGERVQRLKNERQEKMDAAKDKRQARADARADARAAAKEAAKQKEEEKLKKNKKIENAKNLKKKHRSELKSSIRSAFPREFEVSSTEKDTDVASTMVGNIGRMAGGVIKTGVALGKYGVQRAMARRNQSKDKNEQFSNWREEFILEVDDQTVQNEKEKIIDVSKKKNKIEINPNMSEGSDCGGKDETPKKDMRDLRTKVNLAKTKARLMGDKNPIVMIAAEELEIEEGAAWTNKEGKNPSGGLNEKGRKSYERDNPGSDLKAPSKKVGNPRRKSFCARMKGMKAKLTSAKTARDPDSRINKSLRAWNC